MGIGNKLFIFMCHLFNAVRNINCIVPMLVLLLCVFFSLHIVFGSVVRQGSILYVFVYGFRFFALIRTSICVLRVNLIHFNQPIYRNSSLSSIETHMLFLVSANGLIVLMLISLGECWPWPLNQKRNKTKHILHHKLRQHWHQMPHTHTYTFNI